MPFTIGDLTVHHRNLRHGAMVITPKSPMIIGRARLEQLRKPSSLSKVERWLMAQARKRGERARLVLFRAVNDKGERVWQFDPDLREAELEQGGRILSKALLPFHRRLMASGVVLMVHTEWGTRECYAMRHGIRALIDEYDAQRALSPVDEADRWILTHMLLHVALNADHVTGSLLPTHLTMIDRRWPRVRELIAQLPREAID
jgi:hypothetical protein